MARSAFNTDAFKGALTGGGARPNQFTVSLTFPSFANNSNAIVQSQFLVTAASLPGQNIGTTGTFYRGREIKLAGDRTFSDWTVTVINDTTMNIRSAIENWMNGINGLYDNSGWLSPFDYQTNLIVTHLDRNNSDLRTYVIRDAMPINLGDIQLDFANNDTVETYDVTFAVQDFYIEGEPNVSGQARGVI